MVNASAYRKLVHFLWLEESSEPSKISFDELWRKAPQKEQNEKRNVMFRLTDKRAISTSFWGIQMDVGLHSKIRKTEWVN